MVPLLTTSGHDYLRWRGAGTILTCRYCGHKIFDKLEGVLQKVCGYSLLKWNLFLWCYLQVVQKREN